MHQISELVVLTPSNRYRPSVISKLSLICHARILQFHAAIWAAARQNQQNYLCAQRKHRSACASAKSYQRLRCALKGKLRTQCFFRRTAKTDQTARMSMLLWVIVGRTGHFVAFVMRWLISKWSMPTPKNKFDLSHLKNVLGSCFSVG